MALPRIPAEGEDNTANTGGGRDAERASETTETAANGRFSDESTGNESASEDSVGGDKQGSGDDQESESELNDSEGTEEDLVASADLDDQDPDLNEQEVGSIHERVMNEARRNDPLFAPRSNDDTVVMPAGFSSENNTSEEELDSEDLEESSRPEDNDFDEEYFESSVHSGDNEPRATEGPEEDSQGNAFVAPVPVGNSKDGLGEGNVSEEPSLDTAGNIIVPGGRRDRRAQKEEELAKKNNTKKNWIIALVVLLVILVAAGVALTLTQNGDTEDSVPEPVAEEEVETVSIPSAVGFIAAEDEDEVACERFTSLGLECTVTYEVNEEIPRGNSIEQSPEVGEFVEVGETVQLTYSAGPATSEFPAINNESLEYVEELLWAMGVGVEDLEYVSGSGIPEDRVVEASAEEGDTVNNGDSVVVYLSDGTVEIPDWTGETRDVVDAEASDLGVDVIFVTEESEDSEGTVLSQSETGEVNFNDIIEVTVAAPFESVEIEIPDVLGLSPEDAQSDLAEAGFRNISTLEVQTGEVDEETVTQVSPSVGGTGMSEERVVIVVSVPTDSGSSDQEEGTSETEDEDGGSAN